MAEKNTEKKNRRSLATWFREMKSELKKVTWPTPAQVYKNTVIVLIVCAIFAVITWVMDLGLNAGVSFLSGLGL